MGCLSAGYSVVSTVNKPFDLVYSFREDKSDHKLSPSGIKQTAEGKKVACKDLIFNKSFADGLVLTVPADHEQVEPRR